MTQTDDADDLEKRALEGKLTEQEVETALKEWAEGRPGSTLLKKELDADTPKRAVAQYIERERLKEQGQSPAKLRDILARAKYENEEEWKWGAADWTQFDDISRDWPNLTKPPAKRASNELWNALGEFVNLQATQIGKFCESYPRFLPPWFYSDLMEPKPSLERGNDTDPKPKNVVAKEDVVFKQRWLRPTDARLGWQVWQSLLHQAWYSHFHPEYVARLVNIPTVPLGNICDAQRAVLQMMLESWRARFCPRCGRPFVARRSHHTYWPKECFAGPRREKQKAAAAAKRSRQKIAERKRKLRKRR